MRKKNKGAIRETSGLAKVLIYIPLDSPVYLDHSAGVLGVYGVDQGEFGIFPAIRGRFRRILFPKLIDAWESANMGSYMLNSVL